MRRIEVKLSLKSRIQIIYKWKIKSWLRKISFGILFPVKNTDEFHKIPDDKLIDKISPLSLANREVIESEKTAVCYCCMQLVYTNHIDSYYLEQSGNIKGEETAICPHCGIDSLLPMTALQNVGLDYNRYTLVRLYTYMFGPKRLRKDDLNGMRWDYTRLIDYSLDNKTDVEGSEAVGCFYCKQIFKTAETKINFSEPDFNGKQDALCPACGKNTLIGSIAVDYEEMVLDEKLLNELHTYFYGISEDEITDKKIQAATLGGNSI